MPLLPPTLLLPLLLLLLTAPPGRAWGAYTHQYFASQDDTYGGSSTFRAGGSAPDAVKKLEPSLHGLPFAAALYAAAAVAGSAEGIDFALGYGCHLAHDAVGHHRAGFLNPAEDHPLEFAVDTYVNAKLVTSKFAFSQISPAMVALVANASRRAAVAYPLLIHAVNLSAVQAGASAFKTLTTAESVLLPLNRLTYKGQLVSDSYCAVTDIAGVLGNFALATNWSVSACRTWRGAMRAGGAGGVNGTQAAAMLEGYIDGLFAAHNQTSCTQGSLPSAVTSASASASTPAALPLPSWTGPVPSPKVNKSAGLRPVPGVTHHMVYNATAPAGGPNPQGTYNHGPMMVAQDGLSYMSWYNSPRDENAFKRSVFSTSADAGLTWTAPTTLFPNFTEPGKVVGGVKLLASQFVMPCGVSIAIASPLPYSRTH